MSPASPPVFLVDDDEVFLFVAGEILRGAGYEVRAYTSAAAFLADLPRLEAGCLVLDLQMPGMDGLSAQRALRERDVILGVVFVSGRADVRAVATAMKQGAVDFLGKPVVAAELLAVVAAALRKSAAAAAARAVRDDARARFASLSPRQQGICRLLARGYLNKQVAAELGISETTAQGQRAEAMRRLAVTTIAEVTLFISQLDDQGDAGGGA